MTEDGSDVVIVVSIYLIWSSRLCALDVRFKCMERGLLWFPGDNIQWLTASADVWDKNLAESGQLKRIYLYHDSAAV